MRFTPAAISLAAILFVSSSIGVSQKPDPLDQRSLDWSQRGAAAFAAKNYTAAIDAFETALVLDARNRAAFIGLADTARAQGLPGKAIHYYEEALILDPRDTSALQGEGLAMVEKGALESARENLAKIKAACKTACAPADTLASAIAAAANAPQRIVAKSEMKDMPKDKPVSAD